jgi:hypothetical protein
MSDDEKNKKKIKDNSGSFYEFCNVVVDITDESSHSEKQKIIENYIKKFK